MKSFIKCQLLILSFVISMQCFAQPDRQCLQCHGQLFYQYQNEVTGISEKRPMNPFYHLDSIKLAASVHKEFGCIDCHSYEYESFPHDGKLRMEGKFICLDCHGGDETFAKYNFEGIEAAFQESVHYKKNNERFNCWMCHDPHGYQLAVRKQEKVRDIVHMSNQMCLDCHTNKFKFGTFTDETMFDLYETHSWLPNQENHFNHVRCVDCHAKAQDEVLVSHTILPKEEAVRNCVNCHSENSLLMGTLYSHRVKESREENGFASVVLSNASYMVGSHRVPYLNIASVIIFGLLLAVVLIHLAFRLRMAKKAHSAGVKVYLYPLWVRVWHGCNAILFLCLMFSGLIIQYAFVGNSALGSFFEGAIAVHNLSGISIAIAYFVYLVYYFNSENRKHYRVEYKGLIKRLMLQINYYVYGCFKGEEAPFKLSVESKFNPLQQITYVGMLFVLYPVMIFSGIVLLFPELIPEDVFGIGGTFLTAIVHASVGFLGTLFLVIHIYFSTMGPTYLANFKSIVNGYCEK